MKFKWSQKLQENSDKLKGPLNTMPILKVADPDKDFTFCLNESKECLGGVLTKDGHMIFYESRKLKEHTN